MFKVELDIDNMGWCNPEYEAQYKDWVKSELSNIEESCEDNARSYVDNASDVELALLTMRDNDTSWTILDPTNEFAIGEIWYRVELTI